MSIYDRVSIVKAREMLQSDAILFDIRDIGSFTRCHHTKAIHLTNDNVLSCINALDLTTPILVVCYHGNSSQSVAQWLVEKGFTSVFSVDGGMAAWSQIFMQDCTGEV